MICIAGAQQKGGLHSAGALFWRLIGVLLA